MTNLSTLSWATLFFSLIIINYKLDQNTTFLKVENNSSLFSLLFHDYKVDKNGHIRLHQQTEDNFDQLILVEGRKRKVHYHTIKKKILNPHIKIKKGVLGKKMLLKGRANGQHYKGIQLSFKEDFTTAKTVFEFLADYTSIEWSLLSFGINQQTRNFIYTSYRDDSEYFGSAKVHHLLNYPGTIDSLKHYHNHPRLLNEAIGKHAFPSNSDLEFRNKVLINKFSLIEFLIRTDGFYINYTDPRKWNKSNGEDWM